VAGCGAGTTAGPGFDGFDPPLPPDAGPLLGAADGRDGPAEGEAWLDPLIAADGDGCAEPGTGEPGAEDPGPATSLTGRATLGTWKLRCSSVGGETTMATPVQMAATDNTAVTATRTLAAFARRLGHPERGPRPRSAARS
jgi:hypothetical protein